MNGKLIIVYSDGAKETHVYKSVEIAEAHERGIRIALGNQIQFTCVNPTSEAVTVDVDEQEKPMDELKGYWNGYSYMGYVNGKYIPFASESEYREWMG